MKFSLTSNQNRQVSINMDSVNAYTSKWTPGTEFEVEIVRRVHHKKDPIRRFYWAVVLPALMEGVGYEPEEQEMVHHFLKATFFRCEKDERGIPRNVPPLFRNDSDEEMETKVKFVEWVIRKAAEYGVYVPEGGV